MNLGNDNNHRNNDSSSSDSGVSTPGGSTQFYLEDNEGETISSSDSSHDEGQSVTDGLVQPEGVPLDDDNNIDTQSMISVSAPIVITKIRQHPSFSDESSFPGSSLSPNAQTPLNQSPLQFDSQTENDNNNQQNATTSNSTAQLTSQSQNNTQSENTTESLSTLNAISEKSSKRPAKSRNFNPRPEASVSFSESTLNLNSLNSQNSLLPDDKSSVSNSENKKEQKSGPKYYVRLENNVSKQIKTNKCDQNKDFDFEPFSENVFGLVVSGLSLIFGSVILLFSNKSRSSQNNGSLEKFGPQFSSQESSSEISEDLGLQLLKGDRKVIVISATGLILFSLIMFCILTWNCISKRRNAMKKLTAS